MGLTSRQKALFKNKRLYSTIILENIPHLILQVIFSVKMKIVTRVTVYSCIFSILSIVLSISEYISTRRILNCESILVVRLFINSDTIAALTTRQFRRLTLYRFGICSELSKTIGYYKRLIQLLEPIQTKKGVDLIFYIRCNAKEDDCDIILTKIENYVTGEMSSFAIDLIKCWIKPLTELHVDIQTLKTDLRVSNIETKAIMPERERDKSFDDDCARSEDVMAVILMKRVVEKHNSQKHITNINNHDDNNNKGDQVSIEKYKLPQTPQQPQHAYTQANVSAKNLQAIGEGSLGSPHLTGGSIFSNASSDVKETEGAPDFDQTS